MPVNKLFQPKPVNMEQAMEQATEQTTEEKEAMEQDEQPTTTTINQELLTEQPTATTTRNQNSTTTSTTTTEYIHPHTNRPIQTVNVPVRREIPVFWCEACSLKLEAASSAYQHLISPKHLTKVANTTYMLQCGEDTEVLLDFIPR